MTESLTIPHSREAEEAVLGSVFINPDIYHELAGQLAANDFYIHRLRFVWQAFERLVGQGIAIDSLTVTESLEQTGQLDEIGGPAFLTGLLNAVPTSLNADSYAQIVAATSIRRKMLKAANRIAELGYDEKQSVDNAYAESLKALGEAGRSLGSDDSAASISDAIREHFNQIEQPVQSVMPTLWTRLDELLDGGLTPGLYIPAGRPGTGKSVFMLNLSAQLCQSGKRGAIFSLEMSNRQNLDRILASQAKIPLSRIKKHKLLDDDWPAYVKTIEALEQWDLILHYVPGLTPEKLRSTCLRLAAERPLDFVVVDYLQLMHADGFKSHDNRVQELSYISRQLKMISGELDCPVIAASQLSRAVEQRRERRPILSDLRDSGSIEQDSDVVIFLWTEHDFEGEERPEQQAVHVTVSKNRDGQVGETRLNFHGKIARMENFQPTETAPIPARAVRAF